jgi:hypothetical protein
LASAVQSYFPMRFITFLNFFNAVKICHFLPLYFTFYHFLPLLLKTFYASNLIWLLKTPEKLSLFNMYCYLF